ncbi:FtsB family cell division protein [Sinomonas mesophila]|uniref:FtsB family cell division protein n=1 Tax=Sinomonas mesophila TaxID=1531955 RepID=UPI00098558DB|nr:septum formation initiator family protein [Sinomonas mesophila]
MATRRPAVPRTTGNARAAKRPEPSPGPPEGAASAAGIHPRGTSPGRPRATRAAAPPPRTAAAPPSSSDAAHDAGPVPARAFSGRMLALAVVLVAITVMLAPTVRVFLNQRAEISALEADIASKRAEQEGLRQEISRWEDPNYVKQQARDRINMVMPGETSYWVFGDAGSPSAASSGPSAQGDQDQPWLAGVWDSLRRAATD